MRELIQKRAKDCFMEAGTRGVLQIAQRVGKTKIALDIIDACIEKYGFDKNCLKILICYPDNRIVDSWEDDFNKWAFGHGNAVDFCNYASVWKIEDTEYDIVIFDEIHATSDKQKESMAKLSNKPLVVLGLSGTISSETEKEIYEYLELEVLMRYTVGDAIQDGIIAPYEIVVHYVPLDTKELTRNNKGLYISEKRRYDDYTYVIEKMKYENKDFKFLALHRNRVLQGSVAKLKKTKQLLAQLYDKRVLVFTGLKNIAEKLDIPFYHSTSNNPDVFDAFKNKDIDKLAVVNIGRAGVTFPELECIIISSFTGNEETTEQIVARALNKDMASKVAEIHIVCSTEPAEIKKLQRTLASFDKNNIKVVR